MTRVLPFVNAVFCEEVVPWDLRGDIFGGVEETATGNRLAVMSLL
jgi:hypothetical protein